MKKTRLTEIQPMSVSRSNSLIVRATISEKQQDSLFKALSDPTRRGILRLLRHKPLFVTEIVEQFPLTQPTISRHLAVLRRAGLVANKRQGQFVAYRINSQMLSEGLLGLFRDFQEGSDELRVSRTDPMVPVRQSGDRYGVPLR